MHLQTGFEAEITVCTKCWYLMLWKSHIFTVLWVRKAPISLLKVKNWFGFSVFPESSIEWKDELLEVLHFPNTESLSKLTQHWTQQRLFEWLLMWDAHKTGAVFTWILMTTDEFHQEFSPVAQDSRSDLFEISIQLMHISASHHHTSECLYFLKSLKVSKSV